MQGKGFGGFNKFGIEKKTLEEEEKKKSEVEALPNRDRGPFPTSLLLLALYLVKHPVSSSSFLFSFLKS